MGAPAVEAGVDAASAGSWRAAADITRREQVADLLEEISRHMPPLRGVVNSAVVIDDGLMAQMGRDRFFAPMPPKVDGSWHLSVIPEVLHVTGREIAGTRRHSQRPRRGLEVAHNVRSRPAAASGPTLITPS
ncbi:KR domain-containing protein [Streptosporangium roseum]|uniref:KR domain-containing protein n=1 Tax=Streptosporangium roseum TaxID=2001 RepID=UPI003317833B